MHSGALFGGSAVAKFHQMMFGTIAKRPTNPKDGSHAVISKGPKETEKKDKTFTGSANPDTNKPKPNVNPTSNRLARPASSLLFATRNTMLGMRCRLTIDAVIARTRLTTKSEFG